MNANFLKLKYLFVFAFSAILLLNSCHNKNSVSIRVKISSAKDSKIYLDKLDFSKYITIDSADISKGVDKVNFRAKKIEEPTFFVLRVKGKGAITLLSDPGEKMDIIVNADKINDYTVIGSKGSLKARELANKLSETNNKLYALKLKYNLSQDQSVKSMVEQEYNTVMDSQRAFSSRFI